MGNAPFPYDSKYPILLFKDHYFVKLLVLDAHEKFGHNFFNDTITELRSEYYIPNFVTCRKYEEKSYKYPLKGN